MLYVIRHGETLFNRIGRRQGRGDSPLTLRGVGQVIGMAHRLRNELADIPNIAIVSSPAGRCMASAVVLAEVLGIDLTTIEQDPLLAECDFGEWEGLNTREVNERYPGALDEREDYKWSHCPPGGERYQQVQGRAVDFLAKVTKRSPDVHRLTPDDEPATSAVLAVTHEVFSRMLRGSYLGLNPPGMLALKHPHSRIYKLRAGHVEELASEPVRLIGPG